VGAHEVALDQLDAAGGVLLGREHVVALDHLDAVPGGERDVALDPLDGPRRAR
jgi:hypothetical protein